LQKEWDTRDNFRNCQIQQIPQEENSKADQLARLAIAPKKDLVLGGVLVETVEVPIVNLCEGARYVLELSKIEWTKPIIYFLREGTLLENPKEAKGVKCRASRYMLQGYVLYK
jgi:hypothetical protein